MLTMIFQIGVLNKTAFLKQNVIFSDRPIHDFSVI